jgi:hypothetical protein
LGNHKVSSFFETKESPIELQVTNAEILFTNFLIVHNVPIAVSDHAGPLFRKMFPDSEIAKKYGCARTKTSAIIGNLAKDTTSSIAEKLQNTLHACATDGSNDVNTQLYPLVIRYFNKDIDKIMTALLFPCRFHKARELNTIFGTKSLSQFPFLRCRSFTCSLRHHEIDKNVLRSLTTRDRTRNGYISFSTIDSPEKPKSI